MSEDHGGSANIAFVGCGNLGMAILSRAIRSEVIDPATTVVIERDAERRAEASGLGARATDDAAAARGAQLLVLAVKPQHFLEAAQAIGALSHATCVVSVMAGWSSAAIRATLVAGGDVDRGPRVVRAMPNMAAQVGVSMTAIARGAGATSDDVADAVRLFSAIGTAVELREELMDAAVAAVGSAPAYLYLLAEAQISAAETMGFDAATARAMAIQSILGAATLLAHDGRDPAQLRAAVTSAGGTTAAAMRVFEQGGFTAMVAAAMEAASGIREQERLVQLKVTCAISERGLEEKYSETLVKLREEYDFLTQQNGALQPQLRQAHDHQAQMRENYWKEAQRHIESVVANAARREAELVASIQAGVVDPVLRQQLEQVRREAECAQQEIEIWKEIPPTGRIKRRKRKRVPRNSPGG